METPNDSLLFEIDGVRLASGDAPLSPAWLLVSGGVIQHLSDRAPQGVSGDVKRLRGGWIAEPLADAHVHLFLGGSFDKMERTRTAALSRDRAMARVLKLLERYRTLGVSMVRDGGDPHGLALEAAQVANSRPDLYAIVLPAGEPVFRRGRYGGFLGRGVGTADEAIRLLAGNRNRGATHAKILATGLNRLETPGEVGPPQFTGAELAEIVTAARDLGLPAMVHANGPLADVLASGPGSVEHGFWHLSEDRTKMAQTGVYWIPTLGAWAELIDDPGLTADQRETVRATDRRHRDAVRAAISGGVSVAVGSDAGTPGVPHGEGLFRELERLADSGGSASAAFEAARRSRELCLNEAGRRASGLKPGEAAEFVWLESDPGRDVRTLRDPRGVHIGGRWTAAKDCRS